MPDKEFTPEEQVVIKQNWRDGLPPACCTGKCDICTLDWLHDKCLVCGWWKGMDEVV